MFIITILLFLYEMIFNRTKTINLRKIKYIEIQGDIEMFQIISKIKEHKSSELYIKINSNIIDRKVSRDIIFEMSKFKTFCIAEKAHNAAFDIFQLCDKRYITDITNLKSSTRKIKKSLNKIDEIINSIDEKIENLIIEKIKKLPEKSISGKECFKHNLCDEFIIVKK